MRTRHTTVDTDLDPITLVATDDSITGLYFRHHVRRPDTSALGPRIPAAEDPLLTEAAGQLTGYLAGRRVEFDLPLAPVGDEFQQRVWSIVAAIPRGSTTTYGAIATELGDRSLAWQVGQAVGANPLAILIPCHRVVGANGALTGYAGGLRRKRALLALDEADARTAGRLF
ncbi:MAG TPA: methylated-DNA--[protein]-cysteine S-methyltransferase [Flexivirga sp.]|uniref:methylated-DNA--[protein]-cysteine S-methyltransferase n=1 Tax=Flexivirga sp. TaxID=1962927 RepID=UPI002B948C0C|nr:methylated-DNA--[protein]-cysteine S-methyltransferase [Flexivirga sp.]HWC22771.1 methylated-DNA--[protein]-cysteine S-methyltransferase [Flexivirga sp.]